jgi:hypothetical protein
MVWRPLLLLVCLLGGVMPRAQPPAHTPLDSMLQLARVKPGDVVFLMAPGHEEAAAIAARDGWRLVRLPQGTWLTADVSSATVVILAAPREQVDLIGAMLKRELPAGARVVSRQFAIGRWQPDTESRTADGTALFLWTVPRRPVREPDIFFVPTREAVADQMLQLAGITSRDVVYDLGSGDGRIVNLAAQKYGASGVGIEIDPPLVERARAIAKEAGIETRVTFIEGDLFTADISRATIVTLFLSAPVNRRLEPKLRQELRPGTRIVSHQFPIGVWEPDEIMTGEDGTRLYLWTVR